MRFPEEVVVERFVPTVRQMLAAALEKRGLSQNQIADRMGMSQSAVSKHLVGRFQVEPRLAADPRLRETVERVAEGMASRTLGPVEALAQFVEVVRAFEDRGPICTLHEEAMPALQGLGCDLCVRAARSALVDTERVLASVREAARVLGPARGFAALIPHVGANVAMALPGAKDVGDVAALPGGFVEFGGRVRTPPAPEFGVSKALATVLLGAMDADPDTRAAVNLRPDPAFLDLARAARLHVVEMPASDERDRGRIGARLRAARPFPDVLWHKGDFGIEPIAYVLAKDAADAARRVAALLG